MVHVTRYFTALAVLLALFGGYALLVAPWLEPPAVVRAAESPTTAPAIKPLELPPAWAALFPPDAWERKNPKIVETPRCTLLIQDYQTTADGRLELRPCTLIFHSASALTDQAAPHDPGSSRPIVLQAPKAELAFDKPLDLSRASFGRVEKGTLSGEIRIFSPPSQESARDALEIRTRAVWLDKETIRTANDVEFRYGDSSGRGRDLEISLLQRSDEEPAAPRSQLLGVHSLTLRRLEYLRLVVPSASLPGAAPPRAAQSAKLPHSPAELAPTSPLEITCQGEFVFDVPAQVARFQEQVRVSRANLPGIPPDSLTCDELLLTLGAGKPTPKTAPPAADPLAGRLQRIIAMGKPAVLDIGSRAVRAKAAYLEYSLAENSIQLKSDPAHNVPVVELSQLEQHCIAPELHYQLPASGRLGRLHAGGPGELRFLQGRGAQRHFITAQWQRTLEMQPQENNHVITLQGAATVGMGSLGQFSANELHFWIMEAPPSAAAVAKVSEQPLSTPLPAPPPQNESPAILPDRLLAVGDVRLHSPRLDIDTSRLEAWFLNLPADPADPTQPRRMEGPIREPVARVSYEQSPPTGTIHDTVRNPSPQHFHVAGGVIRTQLVLRGNQFDLEDLNIRGQAQVDETVTPEPGLQPLRLRGDMLEIRHGTRPQAFLQITGVPAEVGGRGMSLAGGRIEAYREKNELRVDGPGEAKVPAGGGGEAGLLPGLAASAAPPVNPAPGNPVAGNPAAGSLHIVWNDGLLFDGWTARFSGDVVLRTDSQTAHTPILTATLNRRFDFAGQLPVSPPSPAEPPLALARVLLDGQSKGVYVTGQTFDEFGNQQSREQARVANIAIDQLSGAILAQGPGWVSTVRRSASGQPAAGGQPPADQPPVPVLPPLAGGGKSELTSIHVAFEREIAGDLNQRWIEFRQQVLTTYSPATDFGDAIAADPLGALPAGIILMRSETLRIREVPRMKPPAFELRAQGGTRVEGTGFLVDAPIVGYASNKDTLTIEGDGRATAKVFFKQPREGSLEGQKFWYNVKTGELQMDVIKNIQFNLGPGAGFPFPGQKRN